MNRKVASILILLLAFVSIVFAGSHGMPMLSNGHSESIEKTPEVVNSAEEGERDYVYMKSDEGWQMTHNGRKIMIAVGNFAAYHNGTVITADSAVRYSERHIECFGKVLINRGTTYIYGDRAEYNGDTNEAKIYSKIVKVVDGDATLYTYNFLFNTKSNIGRYSGGGVLISGDNMIESDRGLLYSDLNEVICVDRVQMHNEDYDMMGDSVVYNTETDYAQFFSRTNIWNKNDEGKEDDYLYTDRGSYDKKSQLYKLTKNGYILTEDQEMLCDSLDYYRDSSYILLKRNIQIDDRSQKMMIFADWGEYWKEPGNVFVTKDPSLISYDTTESDSVFMRSDSIYLYTRYPIREKIEQARKDSLAQAEKGDKPTKKVQAEAPKSDNVQNESIRKIADDRGETQVREESTPPSDVALNGAVEKVDTTKVVADTVRVATDTTKVVAKSRSELRRAIIDSLASDTTKQAQKIRARLIKKENEEAEKEAKATMKELQRQKDIEREAVLAERNKLYVKVLGEAKVRDAERRRIEKEEARRMKDSLRVVKDSLKLVAKLPPDSLKIDNLKRDSLKVDSIKTDSLKVDSVKVDSVKVDSVKTDVLKIDTATIDSVKVNSLLQDTLSVATIPQDTLRSDTLRVDSLKVDSLVQFDTMTVKQVKAHFKAIYDKEKAEEERIKQDSLDAKLERIGLARQAKRTEQYRKWEIRDSIYMAKAQERADEQLRKRLARMERRGIYLQMADSVTLAQVDSTLLAEFGPLDSLVGNRLDSLIEVLYPKPLPSPTAIAKSDSLNIDSMYREIRAYSRVKMFRSDGQAICDSLTMTTIDSIIHMYKSPILWNESNQITAEKMHIHTRNSQIKQADFEGDPMMVAEIDTTHYNQVAGKEMVALFRDGKIYRNDVNGNVQTIYYMQEDDSPDITLMAYIEAGDMTSYIENQNVTGITYRGNPTYTFYPMDKIPETQVTKLQGFKWESSLRPVQDSICTRTIRPSQREKKRAMNKPLFPINAILQQRRDDYLRRREWQDRTDTLSVETIEWIESIK